MQHYKINLDLTAGTSSKHKKIDAFMAYMNLVYFTTNGDYERDALMYSSYETKPACGGGELKYCINFCSTCYRPVRGRVGSEGCTPPLLAPIAFLGGVSGPWTIEVVDNNGVVRSLFHSHSANTNTHACVH